MTYPGLLLETPYPTLMKYREELSYEFDVLRDFHWGLPIDHEARPAFDAVLDAINGLLRDADDAIWYYHEIHTPRAITPLDTPEWTAKRRERMAAIEARLGRKRADLISDEERDAIYDAFVESTMGGADNG